MKFSNGAHHLTGGSGTGWDITVENNGNTLYSPIGTLTWDPIEQIYVLDADFTITVTDAHNGSSVYKGTARAFTY